MSSKQKEISMENGSDLEEYSIEEVLLKRGQVYYLAKWTGFSDGDTLQLQEKLSSCDLVALYETRTKTEKEKDGASEHSEIRKSGISMSAATSTSYGFDRNLAPEKILGATTSAGGQVVFLMKWMNSNEIDWVPSAEAYKKCPQTVITCFEENIQWNN